MATAGPSGARDQLDSKRNARARRSANHHSHRPHDAVTVPPLCASTIPAKRGPAIVLSTSRLWEAWPSLSPSPPRRTPRRLRIGPRRRPLRLAGPKQRPTR
jgi:hypothetical protein